MRRFKGEYLGQLDKQKHAGEPVESLPIKQRGRPLLVGAELDRII